MEVLVFKTSVQSPESVHKLTPVLNTLAGFNKWNFALDDCDRILRIISPTVKAQEAIQALAKNGFDCEELE
ncbi:MAG TPA: hypothetical protein PLJ08_01445 [Cyclobacteriaceae bacterium]|nr:hypothetical protein [Cyclobacteriaceae bacterium]